MAPKAKAYITCVVVSGLVAFAASMAQLTCADPLRFASYLLIALIAAVLKVPLPGVAGTLSTYFLFLLIGIIELSLGETVLIGCAASITQLIWHAINRPTAAHIAFNVANNALAGMAAYEIYWELPLKSSFTLVSPVKLALACVVYFAINTGTVAGAIALTENKRAQAVWKECYLWSFPYYLVGASIAACYAALSRWLGWEILILSIPVVYLIFRSYRLYMSKLEFEKRHASEMASLHLRTIEALALAIDAKDHTTCDHLQRVQVYALELAKELGLERDDVDALQAASLLHDIGKLAVPEHIISKPGKLTPEEFEKMKIHPIVGAEILERVQFPYPVVPIVRSHHEKWDGSGYPHGLKGEEIPIGARILAAVDFLDALASDRPYRRALPLDEAMAKLEAESGKHFDPRIVEILRRRYRELEHLARTGPRVTQLATLSTGIKVERGAAPAAGFDSADQRPPAGAGPAERSADFITSIASARQEVQGLFELAQELGSSLSLHDTLAMMAGRLRKMVPYDAVAIWVVRDNGLRAEYFSGDDSSLFSNLEIPPGQGISGWVADNRKPILNGSPGLEFSHVPGNPVTTRLNAALSVPLEGCSDVLGALTVYSREANGFDRDQLRILLAISSKLSVSVENALRFERAESVATTDFLTGLPNARSLFLHLDGEVKRCRRSGEALAVLVCDLDGFKEVNDRFGHLAGNRLLRLAGNAIRDLCREYDYVARMGGDEFVIVLPGLAAGSVAQKARLFAEAVAAAAEQVCGESMVTLSVGEANFPQDGEDAEHLLAEADKRMYKNKRAAKQQRVTERPTAGELKLLLTR